MTSFEAAVEAARKATQKLAGLSSGIGYYLDNVGVPKIKPIHKRVQLLALMYQEALLKVKRLEITLLQMAEKQDCDKP